MSRAARTAAVASGCGAGSAKKPKEAHASSGKPYRVRRPEAMREQWPPHADRP
ncbi:hypothetical protein ACIHEJ_06595 [Streptomyces sp. NPDC052301]|uniref:hypothetical protein n=1 Tax=Streptomyces sp. NPDC052301 TaxID=3365687 RepID=UPI0037CE1000